MVEDDDLVATEALVWLSDRRAIGALLRGLRDRTWEVRHTAAHGLARFRPLPEWVLRPLYVAIGDEEYMVRDVAATALGCVRDPRALPPLVTALDDPLSSVRLAAVQALDDLGRVDVTDLAAAERLARMLDSEQDPYIAYAAYRALAIQGGPAMKAKREAFRRSEWGQTVWWAGR